MVGPQKLLGEEKIFAIWPGEVQRRPARFLKEKLTSRHEIRFAHLGVTGDFLCAGRLLGGRVVFYCINRRRAGGVLVCK